MNWRIILYTFKKINFDTIDIEEFYNIPNKAIFTSIPWLKFLIENNPNAKLLILRITQDEKFIGYFSGMITVKFGIRLLGSPLPGWSTCFMGLDLLDREDQFNILHAVVNYAYKVERVYYIEIIDRNITVKEAQAKNIKAYSVGTLQLDVNKDEIYLFKQMKTDCRNFIRQFERRGATFEIAEADDTFAEEYYSQLIDVFAKQGMVPTYSLEKVKCLLKNLKDSNEVLCLRVRNPEGDSIASSLFVGFKKTFFFWGGASYRSQQSYRPNEYMIWMAIKYWRERGCETFDMVGIRDYKRKFGSHEEFYARLVFTRLPLLIVGRDIAKLIYFTMLKIKRKIQHKE